MVGVVTRWRAERRFLLIGLASTGAVVALWLLSLGAMSCGGSGTTVITLNSAEEANAEDIKKYLSGRSFRQFVPDKDASPRSAVVLDFSNGLSLWAQYAEAGDAISEWEITAADYRMKSFGRKSPATLTPVLPDTHRFLPTECRDCIDAGGVTIEVRNVIDPAGIEFRVLDPHQMLPAPFPAFEAWTKFQEDEIAN